MKRFFALFKRKPRNVRRHTRLPWLNSYFAHYTSRSNRHRP
jgi:hypothetical protein